MRTYDSGFTNSLVEAQDVGIAPAYFLHVVAKHRTTFETQAFNFWSGDDDITLNVELPQGGVVSRTYIGGANLLIDDLKYVADLTDNAVSASLSHIDPTVQSMVRGYTVRFSYCEIHATSWVKGRLASVPQLQWVGIIDEAPISTPSVGDSGDVQLSIRSELMNQLMVSNPAKSSDEHQRRRDPDDAFCQYSGIIGSRTIQWFKQG